jgi:hypothetical protein
MTGAAPHESARSLMTTKTRDELLRGPAIDAGGLAASGGSSDLTPLLELILQKAIALIGAAGGMILLWDEREQALLASVWIEQPFASVTTRIRLGEGLCGEIGRAHV